MRSQTVLLLIAFVSCLCSASPAQGTSEDYSVLNGNWRLTGGWETPQQMPRLTLSMGVNGNQVYGYGDLQTRGCGLSFGVRGQIASDGTFVLNTRNPPENRAEYIGFLSLSIRGEVPAQGSTEWTGTFTTSNGNVKCPNVSGEFVATQFPPLDGTYSGTILSTNVGSAKDTPLDISVNMKQGIFTSVDRGSSSPEQFWYRYLPLKGTVTVSGLIDLPSKEITAIAIENFASQMMGDQFILSFRLEDGSTMRLSGVMADSSGRIVSAF
jgi:hypothetical protein